MKNFLKKNKIEVALISVIIIIALVLRLYRIADFMTFLGDEGRDVRIVRDLITKGNLVFIGPMTSIGNMYLGPLYYYMMAPALFLSRLNPVGPAIMNALLGSFTVFLTYLVARRWFSPSAGLMAALLYALSPVAIVYSRSSWNPNPMPFFALISIYSIYQLWTRHDWRYFSVTAVSFACALQMHYLGLLLAPTLFIFWFLSARTEYEKTKSHKKTIQQTLLAFVLFLILMSPLAIFDMKHSGMNFNAFRAFFSDRQTTVNLNPARSDRFLPVIENAVTDLVLARNISQPAIVIALILVIATIIVTRFTKDRRPLALLVTWLVFGFLGLGIYKQHIYIHYLGFLYPAFYLLLGAIFAYFLRQNLPYRLISVIALIYLIYLSVTGSPVRETPNRQLARTEQAVREIISDAGDKPFNFGLIAKQNYDESYRYFFENLNAPMFRAEDKITDQLYVICEDGDTCKPEGHSQYQIAMFGIAKVEKEWHVDYLRLFKLTHPTYALK